MTDLELAAAAGAALSLAFNYVPGLRGFFARLEPDERRLAMAALLAVVTAGMAIWICTDPAAGGVSLCLGSTNWRELAVTYVLALMANQGVDRISPKGRKRGV